MIFKVQFLHLHDSSSPIYSLHEMVLVDNVGGEAAHIVPMFFLFSLSPFLWRRKAGREEHGQMEPKRGCPCLGFF